MRAAASYVETRGATWAFAALGLAGCNAVFGVDGLSYDATSESSSTVVTSSASQTVTSASSSVSVSSSSAGTGGFGAGGGGGAGGLGGAGGQPPVYLDFGPQAQLSFGERPGADVSGVTEDTTVTGMSPTQNWGASNLMFMDAGSTTASGVIRFDLSMIAPGTSVTNAALDVYVTTQASCHAANATVSLHRLLESWTEGDLFGEDGVANYTHRHPGVLWTEPAARGASHASATMDSYNNPAQGDRYFLNVTTGVVEDWIEDPSSNHGLVFVTEATDGSCLTSSEGEASERPLLRLELVAPSP